MLSLPWFDRFSVFILSYYSSMCNYQLDCRQVNYCGQRWQSRYAGRRYRRWRLAPARIRAGSQPMLSGRKRFKNLTAVRESYLLDLRSVLNLPQRDKTTKMKKGDICKNNNQKILYFTSINIVKIRVSSHYWEQGKQKLNNVLINQLLLIQLKIRKRKLVL